ncbi:uncharacterized protein LOC109828885 isoform X2 [Asparagus officinalis]|uniref:uncharacterized protein LOC109828885 isoform X2 n=1 Tax=Asparagus officinalis TaxID=4686 RepID=UPI00098E1B35|nr:uncharacterized protein LOC109828885 isoform X2 [Asparagus officinalis]
MNEPNFPIPDLSNSTPQIDMETLETPQLIPRLKSSLQRSEFDTVESIPVRREKSLSETLTLKEVERIELQSTYDGLSRRCTELEEQLGRKQREVDEFKMAVKNLQVELVGREMECRELRARVLHLEKGRGVIEISDSEDVDEDSCKYLKKEEGIVEKDEDFVLTPTPKRKRASRMVASESEDDEDDVFICKRKKERLYDEKGEEQELNASPADSSDQSDGSDNDDDVPIGKLIERRLGHNNGKEGDKTRAQPRKRLVKLGEHSAMKHRENGSFPRDSVPQNQLHSQTNSMRTARCRKLVFSDVGNGEDEEVDVDDSDSEDESLNGFIVNDSDDNERNESSSCYMSQEVSDSDVELDDVLATLRRKKDTKIWHYEADMLASFSEDPEICMKAVCALYRQQTLEEQSVKGTIVVNNRGFNQCDAYRYATVKTHYYHSFFYGHL